MNIYMNTITKIMIRFIYIKSTNLSKLNVITFEY